MTADEKSAYQQSLDRVGAYLADCANAESLDDLALTCANHTLTVGDLWALCCAHREGTHRA